MAMPHNSESAEAALGIGRRVLRAESAALTELAARLDDSFCRAVELIASHHGRVVLSGVGKSGLIGRKIASTLSSTGTPALFLHAAEAVHGDLGMVQPGDPVILLSKSGATGELVRLIPTFKAQQNPIVAVVGNRESPLYAAADIVLDVTVSSEADPLGVVPTTSALAMLALGDALACALMARRGFDNHDFARFHPAGQLGRNLLMRVGDVMHRNDCIALVGPNSPLRELVIAMTQYSQGAACVVGEDGQLVGLVTDGDIRRALQSQLDIERDSVSKIMTCDPVRIRRTLSLGEALTLMEDRPKQISVLPVVDDDDTTCIGLLRIHDIYQPHLG